MKKVFEIEWPDDCGEGWMNEHNLAMCLTTENHTLAEFVKVREIPGDSIVSEPTGYDIPLPHKYHERLLRRRSK